LSDVDYPDENISDRLAPDKNSDEDPVYDIVYQIPDPSQ
jgi:hypothetical protein